MEQADAKEPSLASIPTEVVREEIISSGFKTGVLDDRDIANIRAVSSTLRDVVDEFHFCSYCRTTTYRTEDTVEEIEEWLARRNSKPARKINVTENTLNNKTSEPYGPFCDFCHHSVCMDCFEDKRTFNTCNDCAKIACPDCRNPSITWCENDTCDTLTCEGVGCTQFVTVDGSDHMYDHNYDREDDPDDDTVHEMVPHPYSLDFKVCEKCLMKMEERGYGFWQMRQQVFG